VDVGISRRDHKDDAAPAPEAHAASVEFGLEGALEAVGGIIVDKETKIQRFWIEPTLDVVGSAIFGGRIIVILWRSRGRGENGGTLRTTNGMADHLIRNAKRMGASRARDRDEHRPGFLHRRWDCSRKRDKEINRRSEEKRKGGNA
jgi:hypothetical protein